MAKSPEAGGQKEGTLFLRGEDGNPCGVHPGWKVKDVKAEEDPQNGWQSLFLPCCSAVLHCWGGCLEGGSGWMGGLPGPTLAC